MEGIWREGYWYSCGTGGSKKLDCVHVEISSHVYKYRSMYKLDLVGEASPLNIAYRGDVPAHLSTALLCLL